MALPLLMMAGAGILGGAQYLMKKSDERETASMLDELTAQVQASPYANTPMAAAVMQQGQRIAGNSDWMDTQQSERMGSLLDSFAMGQGQLWQAQQAQQAEMADAYSQSNIGIAEDLRQRYDQNLRLFSGVQQQFQSAMTALDNPSNLNSITTLYNLFNILEPGGRVTQNEDGTFSGAGNLGNRAANWLNEWRGEGLTESTRKEILDAIWAQYTPKLEAARRQRDYFTQELDALSTAGRNVRSPIGGLGINYGIQQMPDFGAPPGGQQQQIPQGYSPVNR